MPWSNNQYLDDLLPNSEIHPLDAGHFAWEQAPEEYGRLVADWVTGGYRRVGGLARQSNRTWCGDALVDRQLPSFAAEILREAIQQGSEVVSR